MIGLKRNLNKELVPATGQQALSSSIYKLNQLEDFKISRGKVSEVIYLMNNKYLSEAPQSCKNCAYAQQRAKVIEIKKSV